MSEDNITRISLSEVRERIARGEDRTDWARVDAMTDKDIEAAIADDADWAEFKDIDWSKATIVYPKPKTAVSIRLDHDVVDFFKKDGKGYQTRINAVLRHYIEEKTRKRG